MKVNMLTATETPELQTDKQDEFGTNSIQMYDLKL